MKAALSTGRLLAAESDNENVCSLIIIIYRKLAADSSFCTLNLTVNSNPEETYIQKVSDKLDKIFLIFTYQLWISCYLCAQVWP